MSSERWKNNPLIFNYAKKKIINKILRKPNLATASRDSNWHTPSVVEPVPVWEHFLFLKSVKSTPTESWTLSPSSPPLKSPILLWRSVFKIVWFFLVTSDFFLWRRIFAIHMSGEALIADIPSIENSIIAKFSTFRVFLLFQIRIVSANSWRYSLCKEMSTICVRQKFFS